MPIELKLGMVALVAGFFLRWLHAEKKIARQEVIIKTNQDNREVSKKYAESLEKNLLLSDQISEQHKEELRKMSPDDPRWSKLLYDSAYEVLDKTDSKKDK